MADNQPHFLRHGVVLGLLTALGPFAIDMYLPSLPAISNSLDADTAVTQWSLTAYFVTFALGQLVFGPMSDRFGRKPPLYVGVSLFVMASIGCALAANIHVLIGFRVAEGLGGAAGMVISRAIVRDLHSGAEEVRLLSLLMLVFSTSPVLSPLLGSLIIEGSSWRGIFWFISAMSVIALALGATLIPETRGAAERAQSDLKGLMTALRRLLADREFMSLSFVGALAMSGFFVFLANSSFVFTVEYGLTPRLYSLVFSVNAVSFFAGMQASGWLGNRMGLRGVIRWGLAAYTGVMMLLWAMMGLGHQGIALVVPSLFLGFGCVGLILPVSSVQAFAKHGAISGTASSLMGALQLVCGAATMALTGIFSDGSARPMVGGIALCAVFALLLSLVTMRRSDALGSTIDADAPGIEPQ